MFNRRYAVLVGAMASTAIGSIASAAVHESFVISSSPASTGTGGGSNSDMIFSSTPASAPGTGAAGLQGSASTAKNNAAVTPANVTFKFNVGPTIDALNAQYPGGFTISNPQLTFQYTLYANNTGFGEGAGTFDTYWVANDNWTMGTNDPIYASNSTSLTTWAGSDSNLASTNYAWTSNPVSPTSSSWATNKNGPTMTTNLATDASFLSDITTATAASDPNVSLYLMATNNTLGITIFTSGGTSLPTLSFDVTSVPEPASLGLIALGGIALFDRKRRR